MKKQDLYSSLSVVALALMLTACGDSTNSTNSTNSADASDPEDSAVVDSSASGGLVEDPSAVLSNTDDQAEQEAAVAAKKAAEVADVVSSVGAAAHPKFSALAKALNAVSEGYQALSTAFKAAEGATTYDALAAARKTYEDGYVALGESIDALVEANTAFEMSGESQDLVEAGKSVELQKARANFSMLSSNPSNKVSAIEGKIKALDKNLANLQKTYSLGSSPSKRLKLGIEKVVSESKFGEFAAGKVNFVQTPIEGVSVYEVPLKRREMIMGFFSDEGNQNLVKAGKLDAVVKKIYTEIVKPRLAIEFPDGSGWGGGGTTRYTIAELKAAIKVEAAAGSKDVPGLNGKKYPKFTEDAGPAAGGKPTEAYLTGLEANFDSVVEPLVKGAMLEIDEIHPFFPAYKPAATALALSSGGVVANLSGNTGFAEARRGSTGSINAAGLSLGGVNGSVFKLDAPVFVNLHGSFNLNTKTTDAALGSVAYRMGNTVVGAIQAYANSGVGFGTDSSQLETSVLVSQNLGDMFVEGQLGMVSAEGVHAANWAGLRSHVRMGVDTQFVSPFVEVSYRSLNKDAENTLAETVASLGVEVNLGTHATESYSLSQRVFGKVGYGSDAWSAVKGSSLGDVNSAHVHVEWSGSLTVSGGVGFNTNLSLNSTSGASIALNTSIER